MHMLIPTTKPILLQKAVCLPEQAVKRVLAELLDLQNRLAALDIVVKQASSKALEVVLLPSHLRYYYPTSCAKPLRTACMWVLRHGSIAFRTMVVPRKTCKAENLPIRYKSAGFAAAAQHNGRLHGHDLQAGPGAHDGGGGRHDGLFRHHGRHRLQHPARRWHRALRAAGGRHCCAGGAQVMMWQLLDTSCRTSTRVGMIACCMMPSAWVRDAHGCMQPHACKPACAGCNLLMLLVHAHAACSARPSRGGERSSVDAVLQGGCAHALPGAARGAAPPDQGRR